MANKNFTVNNIKKDYDKISNQIKKVTINGYNIQLKKVFLNSEVSKFIKDVISRIAKIEELKLETGFDVLYYITLLDVFTNIEMPDSLPEQIQVINMIVDLDLLVPIVNEFDGDELNKIGDALRNASMASEMALNIEEREKESVDESESIDSE